MQSTGARQSPPPRAGSSCTSTVPCSGSIVCSPRWVRLACPAAPCRELLLSPPPNVAVVSWCVSLVCLCAWLCRFFFFPTLSRRCLGVLEGVERRPFFVIAASALRGALCHFLPASEGPCEWACIAVTTHRATCYYIDLAVPKLLDIGNYLTRFPPAHLSSETGSGGDACEHFIPTGICCAAPQGSAIVSLVSKHGAPIR